MDLLPHLPWLPALSAALSAPDPGAALECAIASLAPLGLRESPLSPGASPWLELEHAGRSLRLYARSTPPSSPARELIDALLRAALVRIAEHDALRATRERMEMLSAASFEGLFVHIDGNVIDLNARLAEMLGYAPEEVLGTNMMRLCVAPEHVAGVQQRMASRFEGEYVIEGVRKDGSRFRAALQAKQGTFGDRPVRVVAVRDVTERDRTAEVIGESEARLRNLAEVAFDFFTLTRDGILLDAGGNLERSLGYTREQVIGRSLLDFIAPSARKTVERRLAAQQVGSYESSMVSASGEHVPVLVAAASSTLDGKPVRIAGVRDLRAAKQLELERHELQQQVERSQRLESLGVLAGGIAHDFNNLLAGVLGHAELLAMRVEDPRDRKAVEAIRSGGQRAASLTRQMLAYAGQRGVARHEPLDLADALAELRTLLEAAISKKAQLELELAERSVVVGDRATITQVLMNLLTNASDALDGKPGRIHVRTTHVREPDARWDGALGASVRPGTWLLLEVRDTGSGMDASTRSRIFEPFFTTKRAGHGLGLAACLGIVTSHGGAILVESTPGAGSCFSVLLPATHTPASHASEPAAARTITPCKVLVIDDEPLVRAQLRRLLELRGFTVEEADGGIEGLAAHERFQPDVLVLDLSMPDLDGAEVARRLRAAGARVPIVLSSGFLAADAERTQLGGTVQAFLHKPYGLAELLDAIDRARATR